MNENQARTQIDEDVDGHCVIPYQDELGVPTGQRLPRANDEDVSGHLVSFNDGDGTVRVTHDEDDDDVEGHGLPEDVDLPR
jgi:hypothetical protein